MKQILKVLLLMLVTGSAGFAFLYSGIYPMGADSPHTSLTYWALETLREHSIERASRTLVLPDLSSPDLILAGGADYNEMCSACHLEPGKRGSDMSAGLYPQPPNLTIPPFLHRVDDNSERTSNLAREQFWVIKHGIKASGMPAWGKTHDDQRIWAMVAFLQQLPRLDSAQYQILTARGNTEEAHH
ncbi:MAG: cytochrome c [Pseudomonadales bacterium]|nr:cytochrome c [Halioglobus sp.]MCP5129952.1 cytochrome c [Pseudomonadales bacterium]